MFKFSHSKNSAASTIENSWILFLLGLINLKIFYAGPEPGHSERGLVKVIDTPIYVSECRRVFKDSTLSNAF